MAEENHTIIYITNRDGNLIESEQPPSPQEIKQAVIANQIDRTTDGDDGITSSRESVTINTDLKHPENDPSYIITSDGNEEWKLALLDGEVHLINENIQIPKRANFTLDEEYMAALGTFFDARDHVVSTITPENLQAMVLRIRSGDDVDPAEEREIQTLLAQAKIDAGITER